jgi:threonine dehydratase
VSLPDELSDPARALDGIRAAAGRIAAGARRTPIVPSHTVSAGSGAEVHLKLENLQRTGSFKLRGALNKVAQLSRAELDRGLVAASAGNHAQGVALAAQLFGAKATIVMPRATPLVKIQRTEAYGAEVVLCGASWDESQARALELARERGLTPVHPFDDPAVILGQGTVALEILEEVEGLDAIVVPIGGGGLASGVALAVKALAPAVRVIGVQAEGASAMASSLRAGAPVVVERPDTIADGIRVGSVGEITFEIVRRFVDECVTVTDAEIVDAALQTIEKSRVVAEPAGVAAIAALLAGKLHGAERVCAIVSGGNVDPNLLARMIESGLAAAGRYHLVRLRLRDAPGELARALQIVGETGCNVLEVVHYRAGWKIPIGVVDVEILFETRRAGQGRELEASLRERAFEVRA